MTNQSAVGQPRPILLVEDNPDDQLLTVEAFRNAGVKGEIAVVSDGVEAIDFLFAAGKHAGRDASILPQVVILDLKLPKVDGLEVLARIRSDARTRELPIVVLTSSDEERDLDECRRLGADSYIRKPIGFPEFCATVRRCWPSWIGRQRSGDSVPRFHG